MSARKEFRDLIAPDRARALIADLPVDPDDERVPLEAARSRVTAERVEAAMDVPGFDRASMDGYAVRARDTFGADERDPAALSLVGTVHAGEEPTVTVEPGTAVEISTGAVLPPGADAVVMVERTVEVEDAVEVMTAVAPGDHVMAAGADIGAGARAFGPGRRLTARDLALLAALGIDEVPVRGRPVVGIISTGDELVTPGGSLEHAAGQIYDVNGRALAAGIEDAGGVPMVYDPVPDDVDAIRTAVERAADECDLVLSSGSTSASAVDVIYDVIAERGELLAHGVAVKPGKPMIIGRLHDGAAYVGLPGYPVSAQMVFRRFVAPRIREAAGLPPATTASRRARMTTEARFDEGRMRLLPVGLLDGSDGGLEAYPVDKGSGATTSLVDADGVVEVPADTAFVGRGDQVTVHLFDADVQVPTMLGVGEPDLAFHRLLDHVPTPRFLPVGRREGTRRYERGTPDVLVGLDEAEVADLDGTHLGSWRRRWGLVVPAGNPASVSGLPSLVDDELTFANAARNGLREAIDATTAALAHDAGTTSEDYRAAIDGYGLGRPGLESPARQVDEGAVDVGVGLEATADRLELGFVPISEQQLSVWYRPERQTARGVTRLREAVEAELSAILASLPGYRRDG